MEQKERNRIDRAARALLRAAGEQRGPQHVMDTAYAFLGLPIALMDTAFQRIAGSGLEEILGQDHRSEEKMDLSSMRRWMRTVKSSPEPVIDESGAPYRVMCYDVRVQGAEVAKMALYETLRPFRDSDAEILKLLSSALACVLGDRESLLSKRSLSDLIVDLIQETIPPQRLGRILLMLGVSRESNRYLLVMEDPEKNRAVYPILVTRCFHRLNGTAVVLGDTLVCLLEEDHPREVLEAFLRDNQLRGALSRRFLRFEELHDHYLQAAFALETGKREDRLLTLYEDCLSLDLAAHCKRDRALTTFCRPEVLRLRDYDRANGTDYMRTLECYCQNLCSITETARASFLHYNTIKYRLSVIRSITGIDRWTGKDLFEFWLSFRFLEAEENPL